MVAGRYDPQVAQAIGCKHGDPLVGVEGSKDGLVAVAKFINASMAFYDDKLCKKLIQATAGDGARRLAQLRDVTAEELAVLQDWDKHIARVAIWHVRGGFPTYVVRGSAHGATQLRLQIMCHTLRVAQAALSSSDSGLSAAGWMG